MDEAEITKMKYTQAMQQAITLLASQTERRQSVVQRHSKALAVSTILKQNIPEIR